MFPPALLPLPRGLSVTDLTVTPELIGIAVACAAPAADCPGCGQTSDRVHSRYRRTAADLAVAGRRVVLRLTARRFFCRRPDCPRRVFCERLPGLLAARARSTARPA